MIGEELKKISISRYLIHLEFESGSSIQLYSIVEFYTRSGDLEFTYNPINKTAIIIPVSEYIEKKVSSFNVQSGLLDLSCTNGGTIKVKRISDEIEIAAIFSSGEVQAII